MSTESAKKFLGVFKWLYIIIAVLSLVLGIFILLNSNAEFVAEALKNIKVQLPADLNPATVLSISLIVSALVNFVEAYLFKRVIDDGSKSTLLMVLLSLSVGSSIYTVITAFSISNVISLCINAITLYAVFTLRKSAK